MRRILELHIEELILSGFSRRDALRIADALQAEIQRKLATPSLAAFPEVELTIPRIDAGAFKTTLGARAEATGSQIAGRVLGGLAEGFRHHGQSQTGSQKK